tara:strand:+ start:118 stop:1758 length:1641 start_codon:yes stop_codon:yes gene_type:complete
MPKSDTYQSLASQSEINDEIDLRQVFSSLGRHRFLIASITGASLALSTAYAFTQTPVWEGQFQIVLEKKESGATVNVGLKNQLATKLLAEFTGGGDSQLQTEVRILESPLILKPTYEFVKASKEKAGDNSSNLTFLDWRKSNFSIELEKNTSILNISYRDTEPKLILPVLEKISKDYQLYSNRDRSKSIRNGLSFVENQVDKFRLQAASSSRALDAFSIRYGIAGNKKSTGNSRVDMAKLLGASSGTNLMPMELTNKQSSLIMKGDAYDKLASINQELIRRQQRFTKLDPGVRGLIRERDALRRYIELTAGGYLTLPGQQTKTKEEAQEIILKFHELDRNATRDISTLNTLESSLLSLQLEQARQTEPWELISTPTLLDKPVAPRKAILLALGLLAGVVFGSGFALLVDRRTDLVFSTDELKALLPCPLLKHLPAQIKTTWDDAADLLSSGPLATAGKSPIGLVPVGNVPDDQVKAFAEKLSRALDSRELVVSKDLRKTSTCTTQLLIATPGVATRTELSQLNQKLALQGKPVAGWVLLDPRLELS